jgi:hypothetical protein
MNDIQSVAKEIAEVADEYLSEDEIYDMLAPCQQAALREIVCSLSNTPERIIELWNATGLTY